MHQIKNIDLSQNIATFINHLLSLPDTAPPAPIVVILPRMSSGWRNVPVKDFSFALFMSVAHLLILSCVPNIIIPLIFLKVIAQNRRYFRIRRIFACHINFATSQFFTNHPSHFAYVLSYAKCAPKNNKITTNISHPFNIF